MSIGLGADLATVAAVGESREQSEHDHADRQARTLADPRGRLGFRVQIESSRRVDRLYVLGLCVGTIPLGVAHG